MKCPVALKRAFLDLVRLRSGKAVLESPRPSARLKRRSPARERRRLLRPPAVASVGAKAATSAAGIGKAATLLGGLKTALTAIPGWGWVAAAALTAVVIGVKAYNDAQEEQRWALERSSTATAEAIEGYKSATRSYVEFSDTLDTVKELQLKIESSEDNPQTVQFVQDMLDSIEDKKVQVEAIMSQSSLTPEQISDYTEELSQIYTRRAEITILLSGASMTPEQVSSYEDALSSIKDRKAMITARMAEDGLSEQELADLQRSYNSISDLEAEIILTLSGQSLTQEEIAALTAELEGIDSREAEITAEMSEAGMSEEDINDVVRLLNQIGDKQAMINVAMSEESMKTEDIEAMNAELQELYGHLVDTSGGVFTQADVDAGRITPEYFEAYKEQLRIQAEAALYEAQAKANTDMELLPQALENREQARQTYETYVSDGEAQLDEKVFLSELETQRKLLLGQYNAGDIDLDALMEGGEGIISSYKGYYGDRAGPINMDSIRPEMLFGTFSWGQWKPGDTDIFAGAIESVNSNQGYSDEQAAAYQADYERQNAAIVQTYQNQKSLIEGWTFQGTELAGMSLEEVAASYATLDEAGRKMFDDAVLALNALNAQTDYITEGEKTQAVDIVDLAAKAEVMQTVQTQVQQIATDYQAMSEEQRATFSASEEGAAQLAAVNEALSGLGLDQIDSLDQLNEALSALSTVDLSSFSLEAVQSAFSALGGDATGCKTKVDALRSSLEEIDGMNTSSTHTHTNKTINRTITVSGGRVSANANGGIYDGAFLSWVAEDGPEAIIPLGAKRRERGLELWLQAGKMLGVSEFAEGGIMAPYSGALERLPDEAWGDGEFGDGGSASPYLAVRGGGGGGSCRERQRCGESDLPDRGRRKQRRHPRQAQRQAEGACGDLRRSGCGTTGRHRLEHGIAEGAAKHGHISYGNIVWRPAANPAPAGQIEHQNGSGSNHAQHHQGRRSKNTPRHDSNGVFLERRFPFGGNGELAICLRLARTIEDSFNDQRVARAQQPDTPADNRPFDQRRRVH